MSVSRTKCIEVSSVHRGPPLSGHVRGGRITAQPSAPAAKSNMMAVNRVRGGMGALIVGASAALSEWSTGFLLMPLLVRAVQRNPSIDRNRAGGTHGIPWWADGRGL